jgi:hypothetical protein
MRRHDAPARQRLRIVLRWSSVMAWFLAQEVAGQAGDAVTVLGQPPKGRQQDRAAGRAQHEVCIAVPRNSEPPHLDYLPIRVVRLSQAPYEVGIETHKLDGVAVKIYSREKTLADCFKHRNEIGLDTVLEAVRMYKAQGRVNADAILRFASVCRVARVARPYLESLL